MKKLSFRRSRRTLNPAPRIPRIYTWNGGHEAKVVNLNLESATRKVRYEGNYETRDPEDCYLFRSTKTISFISYLSRFSTIPSRRQLASRII